MKKEGNVLIIFTFLMTLVLVIFMFIILIFISEVNSLLYNIKLDMYYINKSAIISVNKGITSRERFSYDKESYKNYFKKMLMANYRLDEELKNTDGFIKQAKILEYDIFLPGNKDKVTNKKVNDITIHSLIEVKIKPIILENILEDVFTFEIHEDVILNTIGI